MPIDRSAERQIYTKKNQYTHTFAHTHLLSWKWNAISLNKIVYIFLWNNLDNNWPVTCRFIARINIDFLFMCCCLWLTPRYCGFCVCLISQKEPLHGRDSISTADAASAIVKNAIYSLISCFLFVDHNALTHNYILMFFSFGFLHNRTFWLKTVQLTAN